MKSKNNGKTLNETQTRQQFIATARRAGCETELRQIFDKFDRLLKTCANPIERRQIAILANVEVHRLFGFRDSLVIDGQEIIPADPDFKLSE